MSAILEFPAIAPNGGVALPSDLAASITRAASKQTYLTIRFLADRDRIHDAYRAYAYFRWVDDYLDEGGLDLPARLVFVGRQQRLIHWCYRHTWPEQATREEQLLVDLIRHDTEPNSGLQTYLQHMMAVMAFDARRRGRLISAAELDQYTRWLAIAVTEALHHFVGHSSRRPEGEARYSAVTAAHIAHMLRDTLEDVAAGYYNIPREMVEANQIDPGNVLSAPYQAWVKSRVALARRLFKDGCDYLNQVESLRFRLATSAYVARFEFILNAIEQDDYVLRPAYPERKSLKAAAWMGWSALNRVFSPSHPHKLPLIISAR